MQLEEHTDIDLLITRYLSGKMDKESFAELKRWSLESESNRKYVRNKLEVWFSSGVADTAVQFDKDKAFSLFKQRIVGAEKKQKQMFRFSWKTFMRVAAVVLILMIPFAAYWQGKQAVTKLCRYGCRGAYGSAYKTLFTGWDIGMAERRVENYIFARLWSRRPSVALGRRRLF